MICRLWFSLRVLHLLHTQPKLPKIARSQLRVSEKNKNQTFKASRSRLLFGLLSKPVYIPEGWRILCRRQTSEEVKFLLSVEVYQDVNKAELFGKLSSLVTHLEDLPKESHANCYLTIEPELKYRFGHNQ